jgi:hypothetical protein
VAGKTQGSSRPNPLHFQGQSPLGAPRIHGELIKLGYELSEATIAKYMIISSHPPSQTWRALVKNHLRELVAIDFFTVPTVTFKTLYVLLVLSLDRRRIISFNVADSPTADWIALQIVQAFPFESAPRYLIRDRDALYGHKVIDTLKLLGIKEVVISYQSPWQSGHVERLAGSLRRECLDHFIIFGECHLRRILKKIHQLISRSQNSLGSWQGLSLAPGGTITRDGRCRA